MPRTPRSSVTLSVVVVCVQLLTASQTVQPNAAQLATIAGRVTDASTGEPIALAQVSLLPEVQDLPPGLSRPPRQREPNPSMLTDTDGRFVLKDLRPGSYVLQARKSGHIGGFHGQFSPYGSYAAIGLGPSESLANLTLRLWRQSVITGTLRNQSGDPIPRVPVQTFQVVTVAGSSDIRATLFPGLTDDRGEYRITNLEPGSYLVCAGPLSSRPTNSPSRGTGSPAFVPGLPLRPSDCSSFFPGNARASGALPVTVGHSGDVVTGIDFVSAVSVAEISVTGRIEDFRNCNDAKVRVVVADGSRYVPEGLELAHAPISPEGTFSISGIAPGTYTFRGLCVPRVDESLPGLVIRQMSGGIRPRPDTRTAIAALPRERLRWFSSRIEVGAGHPNSLLLRAQDGSVVSGRIVPEPELRDSMTAKEFLAIPIFTRAGHAGWNLEGVQLGRVEADGQFTSASLPPGKFMVLPMEYGDWYSEAAMLGGTDFRNQGFDIAGRDLVNVVVPLTRRRAHVAGTVRDGTGKPRADAVVYLFPADRRDWEFGEIRELRPNRAGEYSTSLYAGSWVFAAVSGALPANWRDSEFLQSLVARGKRVSLAKGERGVADLIVQLR